MNFLKVTFVISILALGFNSAQAEDVAACGLGNGDMIHKIVQKTDGSFCGHFDLPLYRDFEADSRGQIIEVNAPLSDSNVFSNGLPFLKEKSNFLKNLFKSNGETNANLKIKFDHCENQSSADKKLKAWFCNATTTSSINGVAVHRVDFSLQNQTRTSLVGENGETAEFDVYYAELTFTVPSKNGKTMYKSSYSYFPNGNSIQCLLK